MFRNYIFILFVFFPHPSISHSHHNVSLSAPEPGNWDWPQVIQKGINYLIPIIDKEIANQKDEVNKSILRIDETVSNNSKKIDDLTSTLNSMKVDIVLLRSSVANVGQLVTDVRDDMKKVKDDLKKVNDNLELINKRLNIVLPTPTPTQYSTTAPVILQWIENAKSKQTPTTVPSSSRSNKIIKEA